MILNRSLNIGYGLLMVGLGVTGGVIISNVLVVTVPAAIIDQARLYRERADKPTNLFDDALVLFDHAVDAIAQGTSPMLGATDLIKGGIDIALRN